ncbi:MAG TPA: response regulator [Bacteroidales bacterium]|nr:response regulator [Bacteroidales bacterium]HPO64547.1 response regulator [Bacteroidales bacterium]
MPDLSKYTLLIVEDDVVSVELVKSILVDTGIRIEHVLTGLEAVKLVKRGFKPDVILMDMRLPEMDGYQATQIIKGIHGDIPIIAQTAFAMTEDRQKCMAAGCDEYITKPYDETMLLKLLTDFLQRK